MRIFQIKGVHAGKEEKGLVEIDGIRYTVFGRTPFRVTYYTVAKGTRVIVLYLKKRSKP